jgi:hypothetical protein
MHVRVMPFLVGAAVIAAWSPASAQHWGEDTPRDGACFYEDPDYRGDYFCAETGESLSTLASGVNDRISSIRIHGRAEVTVYRDSRYGGPSERFGDDVEDLRDEDWNDRISSLKVRRASTGSSGQAEDPDRIVRRAYDDILEREPDDAGLRLYRSRIIDEGWTEKQVREALRKSPEYRQKARAKAEEIVRRAYLAVFEREPDSESRGYVERVLRDKWTQEDVERELRKSPEYRSP